MTSFRGLTSEPRGAAIAQAQDSSPKHPRDGEGAGPAVALEWEMSSSEIFAGRRAASTHSVESSVGAAWLLDVNRRPNVAAPPAPRAAPAAAGPPSRRKLLATIRRWCAFWASLSCHLAGTWIGASIRQANPSEDQLLRQISALFAPRQRSLCHSVRFWRLPFLVVVRVVVAATDRRNLTTAWPPPV